MIFDVAKNMLWRRSNTDRKDCCRMKPINFWSVLIMTYVLREHTSLVNTEAVLYASKETGLELGQK
jgi:hypothetical protein